MASITACTTTSSVAGAVLVHKASLSRPSVIALGLPAMSKNNGKVKCSMERKAGESKLGMCGSLMAAACAATISISPAAMALVDERMSTEGTGLPFGLSNNLLGWILFGVFGLICDSPGSEEEEEFFDLDNESDLVGSGLGLGRCPRVVYGKSFRDCRRRHCFRRRGFARGGEKRSRFGGLVKLSLRMERSSIGMICNTFPETLSKLLLALCPNITSSRIQFAAAQLPNLELTDCCMTICNPDLDSPKTQENNDLQLQRTPHSKMHLIYQKLIINHTCLKKLSLWGCSGLDALYLNCPELNDLNLNSCTHLNPERLLLQCPILECVPALGCRTRWFKSFRIRYAQILWPGKIIFIANVFLIALKGSGNPTCKSCIYECTSDLRW
ncbi:hypothetical protein HAX54_019324 [Datura stramonium]|uniref:PSII 6.1 kDa protein n=1 Tax=Datura stramonium TaxID=4076 RepID=A0ABS8UR90_DATST|nr:hypothetical protein [Datura stramonium]